MPVVKVWLLPPAEQKQLEELIFGIIDTILAVPEMGLSNRSDVTVLLPADLVEMALGEEIIVEITKIFDKPERDSGVLGMVANRVGSVVAMYALDNLPQSKFVEVFLETFQKRQTRAFRYDIDHADNKYQLVDWA
jgi:hypothetical protein